MILAIDAFLEYVMTHQIKSLPRNLSAHYRHVHHTYPGVRVFHEDRDDIPHGAEIWKPSALPLKCALVTTF